MLFGDQPSAELPGDLEAISSKPPLLSAMRRRKALRAAREARAETVVYPFDATIRAIGDMWTKKMASDITQDKRGVPRLPMARFTREYFLRRYGFRHLATKAYALDI